MRCGQIQTVNTSFQALDIRCPADKSGIQCRQESAAEVAAETAENKSVSADLEADVPKPKLEALWGRTIIWVEAGIANFSTLVLSAPPGSIAHLVFHLIVLPYEVDAFPPVCCITIVSMNYAILMLGGCMHSAVPHTQIVLSCTGRYMHGQICCVS